MSLGVTSLLRVNYFEAMSDRKQSEVNPPEEVIILRKFRLVLGLFIFGLVVSGITAFSLQHELDWLTRVLGIDGGSGAVGASSLDCWILTVRDGLRGSYARYPWLAYGTDWLAFGHIVIAIFLLARW
jgi:hypothetical protein